MSGISVMVDRPIRLIALKYPSPITDSIALYITRMFFEWVQFKTPSIQNESLFNVIVPFFIFFLHIDCLVVSQSRYAMQWILHSRTCAIAQHTEIIKDIGRSY